MMNEKAIETLRKNKAERLAYFTQKRDELMDKLGIPAATVLGVNGRRRRTEQEVQRRTRLYSAMYDSGATFTEISKVCSCDPSTVSYAIDRLTGLR